MIQSILQLGPKNVCSGLNNFILKGVFKDQIQKKGYMKVQFCLHSKCHVMLVYRYFKMDYTICRQQKQQDTLRVQFILPTLLKKCIVINKCSLTLNSRTPFWTFYLFSSFIMASKPINCACPCLQQEFATISQRYPYTKVTGCLCV